MTSEISAEQIEKARAFAAMHIKGAPLVLYNIWDAGSAQALVNQGDNAVATGSWSVAAAQGFADGEQLPLDLLLLIAERITATVSVPVSVDFEGAYAKEPSGIAHNITCLIKAGTVGCNFEDQIVGGDGLYKVEEQAERIAAIRLAADALGIDFFINARTDLFLKEPDAVRHIDLITEAKSRAAAYQKAGASGFFVPGLMDASLIKDICASVDLPVNAMKIKGMAPNTELAALGVARISYGPGPYRQSLRDLKNTHTDDLNQ